MSKTIGAILIMAVAAFAGLFLGAYLNDVMGGMILLALIAGIACIIYTLEKTNKDR